MCGKNKNYVCKTKWGKHLQTERLSSFNGRTMMKPMPQSPIGHWHHFGQPNINNTKIEFAELSQDAGEAVPMAGWRANGPTPIGPQLSHLCGHWHTCCQSGTTSAGVAQGNQGAVNQRVPEAAGAAQPRRPFPGTHSAQLPPPVFAFHIFHFPHTFLFNPILAMKKVAAEGAGFGLSAQQKGRSEEHIHSVSFWRIRGHLPLF